MNNRENIGILAIEVYFPKHYVDQSKLEQYDKVSAGKYTIGLGQEKMSFIDQFEDVNSMALTGRFIINSLITFLLIKVVQNLFEKYFVDPKDIGRLEIGTESLIDKSKSLKTVLMQLFQKSGNFDVEGVTNLNACYGATSALFNTINWIESSSWDGRFGLVVGSDVAVYAKGPARPTGGCGAIALLIGPNAPIIIQQPKSTYMNHAYDFYKPDPKSEYPTVDGQLSISSYLTAIEQCYKLLNKKLISSNQEQICVQDIDYICFHTPFIKMVQKSFLKLVKIDILNNQYIAEFNETHLLQKIKQSQKPFQDQEMQKDLIQLSNNLYNQKTIPSLFLAKNLGNIYTGALYGCLASLIFNQNNLINKRILMFSYGSGLASSMFICKVNSDLDYLKERLNLTERINQRLECDPEKYNQIMEQREKSYGNNISEKSIEFNNANLIIVKIKQSDIFEGTFYIQSIDNKWRRTYKRLQILNKEQQPVITKNNLFQKNFIPSRLDILTKQITQNNLQNTSTNNKNQLIWAGFYKKTFPERIQQLKKIDPDLNIDVFKNGGLSLQTASHMVENCIGKLSLPIGIGLNFLINGKYFTIPMVIEEPSVIAAASSAAKFIAEQGGGFKTYSTRPIMIGQIQVLDCDLQSAQIKIDSHRDKILALANSYCPSLVKRGGGVLDVKSKIIGSQDLNQNSTISTLKEFQIQSQMLIVELHINVCESMGANLVNSICENVSEFIQQITMGRIGIRILTNLCNERRTFCTFTIPVSNMGYKGISGVEVSKRILETFQFAKLDIQRAATHNKGIMNGIDSVAIAFGQDWRAIEAAAHSFAFQKFKTYQPLSQYEIITIQNQPCFRGCLEIPISVGSVGGVIDSNPIYKNCFRIAEFPTAQQLSELMVAVGLAQNFAALRALAIEGIQKGHMKLHSHNIAIAAGVPEYLINEASNYMIQRKSISKDIAEDYLRAIDFFSVIRTNHEHHKEEIKLSTFYIQLENINIHVAFDCWSERTIHLSFQPNQQNFADSQKDEIFLKLFGEKSFSWLQITFEKIHILEYQFGDVGELIQCPSKDKIKMLIIMLDLLAFNLVQLCSEKLRFVFQNIITEIANAQQLDMKEQLKYEPIYIKYGLALFGELLRILNFSLDQVCKLKDLKQHILTEVYQVIQGQITCYDLWNDAKNHFFDFNRFLKARKKRMCITAMILCDSLQIINYDKINDKLFSEIKNAGDLYEIEMTFAHDLSKWSHQMKEFNIYTYWLMMNSKFLQGSDHEVLKEFIDLALHILKEGGQNEQGRSRFLSESIRNQNKKTIEILANYYKFEQSEDLKKLLAKL